MSRRWHVRDRIVPMVAPPSSRLFTRSVVPTVLSFPQFLTGHYTAMHEASLVESLLDQIAAHVREWGENAGGAQVLPGPRVSPSPTEPSVSVASVTRVVLEIGPLSGVEPELVRLAFERLAPIRGLARAELAIEWVPLTTRCETCGAIQDREQAVFRCSGCGGHRVGIERGDAVILKSFELEIG